MSPSDQERSDMTLTFDSIIASHELSEDDEEDPTSLLLRAHESWKDRGGKVRGKRRNSERQLLELLASEGNSIASLTPKLNGRTRFTPSDARALIECMLANWEYYDVEADADHPQGYVSPYSKDQIEEIGELLASAVSNASEKKRKLSPKDARDLIIEGYKDSDAIFTVSMLQTLIVLNINKALVGFRNLLNRLWSIDRADDRKRALIWILDLGGLSFDDEDSQSKFINVENLATRFKALRRFEDDKAEERWKWLKSHAVIVIRTRRVSVIDDIYNRQNVMLQSNGSDLPYMTAENILLSAIPEAWATADEFKTLYGRDLGGINKRTYTILYSGASWASSPHLNRDLRYYALAQEEKAKRVDATAVVTGLELPSPDSAYDEAYRTIKTAAFGRLGFSNGAEEQPHLSSSEVALTQLRSLGFGVLLLEEFLDL